MSVSHLVKVGLMAKVGHFVSADSLVYPRDAVVICRTERGLESGQVICEVSPEDLSVEAPRQDGSILRFVTPDDQLILDRLERYRDNAFFACEKLLKERKINSTLVDVEHLFDGESVFFYFLGEVAPELETLTSELASTYDRKVRFKKFAETLANGCGPECGTKEGSCSSSGCAGCSLAKSCKS